PVLPMSARTDSPIYYPGTPRAAEATAIILGPGEERRNIDIPWMASTPTRISGVVSTADGSPLPTVSVLIEIAPGSSSMSNVVTARPSPDGRFSTPAGLPPGAYTVLAQAGQQSFAVETVDANGTDVALQLILQPSLQISGRIVATGVGRPP